MTALVAACAVAVFGGLASQPASAAITSCPGTGATFAGGSGTTADPYQVATAAQLVQIQGTYLPCSFQQTAAISLTGRQWVPIGPGSTASTSFSGEFDGGGHAITGMMIGTDGTTLRPAYLGLFGALSSARINAVDVSGSINVNYATPTMQIWAVGATGGLAGAVWQASPGTVISDVTTNVTINLSASFGNVVQGWVPSCLCSEIGSVGGLVGSLGPGTTISAAAAHGDVSVLVECALPAPGGGIRASSCYSSGIGGLVGTNSGVGGAATTSLEQVVATGDVTTTISCTGDASYGGQCRALDTAGLLASTTGPATIIDPRASGAVSVTCSGQCTGAFATGGLVGEGANLTILRARSGGSVSINCPHGVVGSNQCSTDSGGLAAVVNGGSITQSFAAVTATTQGGVQAGGLMGLSQGASVTDSFARAFIVQATGGAVLTSAGGLVGSMQNAGVAQRSYAAGQVNSGQAASGVGGLIGTVASGGSAATSAVWNTTTTGQSVSAGGGSSQTTSQMTAPATYGPSGFLWPIVEGWQRPTPITTWGICPGANAGYPFLLWSYDSSPCMPDAPTAVTALPGSGQATVQWVAPISDGGSPITSYLAEVTTGSPSCTATPPVTSCTITGLTNSTTYSIRVQAINANGASPWSSTTSVTPAPAARPGAPTTVVATVPGPVVSGAIDVGWTAPADMGAGASAISSYTATASPGGATCTSSTGGPPVTPSCRVTGLTDGTQYTSTVTATNNLSVQSVPSAPSSGVRPGGWTVPGAPTGATGVAGNTIADVSWTAPASAGGSGATITGYTVTATPGGKTCTAAGTVLTCRVVGLDDGTAYTFRVTATNVVGTSAPSAASSPVTPRLDTVPDPPLAPAASAASEDATVSWTAPVDDGGSAINGYMVTATPGGATCPASGAATTCTVTGLANATAYTFTVRAMNALGTSSASGPSDPVTPHSTPPPVVTPASPPGAPGGTTATAGSAQVAVLWSEPASDGGAAISAYTVTSTPDGRTCAGAATDTTCVVTGLTNGTAYTFTVAATNAAGTSPASVPSSPVTPSAPLGTLSAMRRTTVAGRARIVATLTAGRSGSFTVALVRSNGRVQRLLAGSRVGGVRTTGATTPSVTVRMSAGRRYPLALLVARSAPGALSVRLAYTQPAGVVGRQTIPLSTATEATVR